MIPMYIYYDVPAYILCAYYNYIYISAFYNDFLAFSFKFSMKFAQSERKSLL